MDIGDIVYSDRHMMLGLVLSGKKIFRVDELGNDVTYVEVLWSNGNATHGLTKSLKTIASAPREHVTSRL